MGSRRTTRTFPRLSRRGFLEAAALGSPAAVLAAYSIFASSNGRGSAGEGPAESSTVGTPVPLLAYIRDAASGELVVLVGAREVVHHDRVLTARLVALAREGEGHVVAS